LPPAAVNPGANGAGKNVGNRLYINFGTASRFGSLLPFVERNKSNYVVSNKSSPTISKKAGWSWDCVLAIDSNGRTMWIVDAHRDEKRFVVHADEKLTAFCRTDFWVRQDPTQKLGPD
jgi:hypothetical protein